MNINEKLIAVCGLNCAACTLYIASTDDRVRLQTLADMLGISTDEALCYGCGSDTRYVECRECEFLKCSQSRDVKFCSRCKDYPCSQLEEFQKNAVHRIELWESLELLKKEDLTEWNELMEQLHTCPECGTMNSAYDVSCRKCKHEPASEFVRRHKDSVLERLKAIKK